MPKTAHTPGPWYTSAVDFNRRYILDADGYAIAEVTDRSGIDLDDPSSANMRLLKAAPDLLAALTATVQALEYWFPRYGDPEGANSLMMQQARAAIAQAEGDE